TDAKLGGVPVQWVGFTGFQSTNIYKIEDGKALAVSTNIPGAVGPNVRLSNLAIQFKLARLDVGLPTGNNQFVDLRKATDGAITTYRLSFNPDGNIRLMYRSPTSPEAIIQAA